MFAKEEFQMRFFIQLSNATKDHPKVLQKAGIKHSVNEKTIEIEANPLTMQEPVPARTKEEMLAFFAHCKEKGEIATYKTKFLMKKADGTEVVFSSILACTKLDVLSALIAKPRGEKKAKVNEIDLADLGL